MTCLQFHQNTQDYTSKLLNRRRILWWPAQSGLLVTVDYKAALLACSATCIHEWHAWPAIAGPFAPLIAQTLH